MKNFVIIALAAGFVYMTIQNDRHVQMLQALAPVAELQKVTDGGHIQLTKVEVNDWANSNMPPGYTLVSNGIGQWGYKLPGGFLSCFTFDNRPYAIRQAWDWHEHRDRDGKYYQSLQFIEVTN